MPEGSPDSQLVGRFHGVAAMFSGSVEAQPTSDTKLKPSSKSKKARMDQEPV
jgi:hypothetical protein